MSRPLRTARQRRRPCWQSPAVAVPAVLVAILYPGLVAAYAGVIG